MMDAYENLANAIVLYVRREGLSPGKAFSRR